MHMVQEMKTLATDQPITVEQTVYTKGTKTRVEMKMPLPLDSAGGEPQTMQTIMINDGSNAWIFSPLGEKKQLSPEEAKQYEPSRNCWGFFPDNARVIGSDSAQGRDCYIVELEDEGVLTRLWLDKSDFIPVQGQTHDSTGAMQYHWVHSDFHKIRGQWEYPYMTKMYNGDTLTVQMSVTSLEVNQGLSDELFNPDSVRMKPLNLNLQDLMKMMVAPADSDSAR